MATGEVRSSHATTEFLGALLRRIKTVNSKYSLEDYEQIKGKLDFILTEVDRVAGDMMGAFDRETFATSTRGLSLKKPSHVAFEELGKVGVAGSSFSYPAETIRMVASFYSQHKRRGEVDLSLSIPRGKNAGWPTAIGGTSRDANNAALVATVHAMEQFKRRHANGSLADFTRAIEQAVDGEQIMFYGERQQHTSKLMPCHLASSFIAASDVEPRVRMINMSPKHAVFWNRYAVKDLMRNCLMKTPLHEADKNKINERVSRMFRRGWCVRALDQSKFDFHHGGLRLQSILDVVELVCGKQVRADFQSESTATLWYPTTPGDFQLDRSVPLLPSGISWTTAANCIGSVLALFTVMPKLGYRVQDLGRTWDALSWGDDLLVATDQELDEKAYADAYSAISLSVTFEPNIRFLGFIYDKGYTSYARHRLFQSLLPERVASPELYKLGAVTRIGMYGFPDRDKMIDAFVHLNNAILPGTHHLEKRLLIQPLTRNVYVKEGIAAANKNASDIGALDEVLHRLAGSLDDQQSYDLLGLGDQEGPMITRKQAESEVERELLAEIRQDAIRFIATLSGPQKGDSMVKISSLTGNSDIDD